MSTSYYLLREPITSLRIDFEDNLFDVIVWVNGEEVGRLTLSDGELNQVLRMFTGDFEALHTHWGGKDIGTVVTEHQDAGAILDGTTQVISEYGELLTVGQVRARAGAKRADGMPTELFGYEEAPK
jgi:hypothetical protein